MYKTKLHVDALEAREVPAVSVVLTGTVLTLRGDGVSDFAEVRPEPGGRTINVRANNPAWRGGVSNDYYDAAAVREVRFYGNGGRDTFRNYTAVPVAAYGGDGDDDLLAGWAAGTLSGGAGNDTLHGSAGDDQLYGGADADLIGGNFGNDRVEGGDGRDTIDGSFGSDFLYGGDGNDRLRGGDDGDDTLHGGDGSDDLDGGVGNDVLYGRDGHDTLRGGAGNDRLYGDDGVDTLYAGAGDDFLDGGGGDDGLFGWTGNDTLAGGTGEDRFLRHQAGSYTYRDADWSAEALVRFKDAGPVRDAEFTGWSGEYDFAAGAWTEAEIERVDVALGNLHAHLGNGRLLKTAAGGTVEFNRVGNPLQPNSPGGWNGGGGITFVGPLADDHDLWATVYHEIGHNWDEGAENRHAGAFRAVSGWVWTIFPTAGLLPSAGSGDSWYYRAAAAGTFARGYGMLNPFEDYATTFERYFMTQYHTDWTFGDSGDSAAKFANLELLFADLR